LFIECFEKGVKFLSHMLPYMPFKGPLLIPPDAA
jgi:hypothetical protein